MIIVTADDFGITPGVSEGILEAFESGAVHRASAMTNMPAFARAVEEATRRQGPPLGVHGNLTCGRPLTDPAEVPSLVGPAGRFRPLRAFVARLVAGRIRLPEVEREIEAQIEALVARGHAPTHLDSHQHLHYVPSLGRIWLELARRHGIPYVRFGRPLPGGARGLRAVVRNLALSALAGRARVPAGVDVAPYLALFEAGSPLRLERARGQVEVVCHPGRHDAELALVDPATPDREAELAALKSLRLAATGPGGAA